MNLQRGHYLYTFTFPSSWVAKVFWATARTYHLAVGKGMIQCGLSAVKPPCVLSILLIEK